MADPGLDPVGHTGESAEVARVDPAAPFVTVEELLRARLGAAFGGWRGALESACLLYTSPSPRDGLLSRMPSSA